MRAARLSTMATLLGAVVPAGVVTAACGKGRAPFASSALVAAHRTHDAGAEGGIIHIPLPALPDEDAAGICGRTVVPIVVDRVNLYFIVDNSGSMADPMGADAAVHNVIPSKYDAAGHAIHDVLMKVGHRVWYGAALFPGEGATQDDVCPAGGQVFTTSPGDDASYAAKGEEGPTLKRLERVLAQRPPDGLTPTAATLGALKSQLLSLSGKTYALLLTDGAPNCNDQAVCSAATCTPNIEGLCPEPPGVSCCDPSHGYDNRYCLDADPTLLAVEDLAGSGIQTFVVGMPGTEDYETLLDQLAVAGGTAQTGAHKYFPVQSEADLSTALQDIGLQVAITCDVPLAEQPPDRDQVNVYFDQSVVPLDAKDGWAWTGADSIRIVGSYCSMLQTGSVLRVQVVAGCPSITR
jgi:hypothetical protein